MNELDSGRVVAGVSIVMFSIVSLVFAPSIFMLIDSAVDEPMLVIIIPLLYVGSIVCVLVFGSWYMFTNKKDFDVLSVDCEPFEPK